MNKKGEQMKFLELQNRMARIEIILTQGHTEYLDKLNEYVALYLKLQKQVNKGERNEN
tara:strand:- start:92 stop:265 length:174 start_codon:yes stop_codon:yes gene_type:complete